VAGVLHLVLLVEYARLSPAPTRLASGILLGSRSAILPHCDGFAYPFLDDDYYQDIHGPI
jgi:hypothetical protein